MRIIFRILLLLSCAQACLSQTKTVVLKRAWINEYKDRATIVASFTVDHAHAHPNPPAKDGDMHVAGRAPKDIGLPLVAEVMNAAAPAEQAAVSEIHRVEGTGNFVSLTGAWRVWFEHPADSQVQFSDFPAAANTNPDHSFEVHPITDFGGEDLTASLYFIPKFKPKDAQAAFSSYEKLPINIRASGSAVTLSSNKSGYNYVEFTMRLVGKPGNLADNGMAALADVYESADDEEAIVKDIRMIFVANTPPWKKLRQANAGDGYEMRVLGIPRVNLSAIAAFVDAAEQTSVRRKLPYEMIIVGVK